MKTLLTIECRRLPEPVRLWLFQQIGWPSTSYAGSRVHLIEGTRTVTLLRFLMRHNRWKQIMRLNP